MAAKITPNGRAPDPMWQGTVDAHMNRAHATNVARRNQLHAHQQAEMPTIADTKPFKAVPDTQSY